MGRMTGQAHDNVGARSYGVTDRAGNRSSRNGHYYAVGRITCIFTAVRQHHIGRVPGKGRACISANPVGHVQFSMTGAAKPADRVIGRLYSVRGVTDTAVAAVSHGSCCAVVFIVIVRILVLPLICTVIFISLYTFQEAVTVVDVACGIAPAVYILVVGAFKVDTG